MFIQLGLNHSFTAYTLRANSQESNQTMRHVSNIKLQNFEVPAMIAVTYYSNKT